MSSKRRNHAGTRRKVRRAEKRNLRDDAPARDKTIGHACRRGYGAGAALS